MTKSTHILHGYTDTFQEPYQAKQGYTVSFGRGNCTTPIHQHQEATSLTDTSYLCSETESEYADMKSEK